MYVEYGRMVGGGLNEYEKYSITDSVLCPNYETYTSSYVETLLKSQKPMIFKCPSGTLGSNIRLAPGKGPDGQGQYAELAEVEVYINRKTPLKNPRFALPDSKEPNSEGTPVDSFSDQFHANKSIDGNNGMNEIDHVARPVMSEDTDGANFFVDLR